MDSMVRGDDCVTGGLYIVMLLCLYVIYLSKEHVKVDLKANLDLAKM